jgi:hypothetical protein
MDNLPDSRMIVLAKRLRFQGLLETMTDQTPEIRKVVDEITSELPQELAKLDGDGWHVTSHSVTIYNGLVIATFYVSR